MQLLRPQASISCCGTSFSITGVIFSGKMPLGTPKKRVKSKKIFSFRLKKSSARFTCNCAAQKHQTGAAGRVLRLQGCPAQERRVSAALKRGSSQKNSFPFAERQLARASHALVRQCNGPQESNCCNSVSFSSCGVRLSGKAALEKRVFYWRTASKAALYTASARSRFC